MFEKTTYALAIYEASIELQAAESFFNQAETHQVGYAIARLNAAREKVDMLLIEAKMEVKYA
jgi:hypothetical protein